MATNAFLPFATAPGANVATAADYTANSNYAGGYVAGVATSKFLNFTWRQSSFMTSALGQMIADYGLVNAVDDGSISNLENSLVAGIQGATPGRLMALRVFTSSGTYTPTAGTKSIVVEVVGAGGAGGAAQGTGASQISGGAGGGAGGRAIKRITSPTAQTLTIGVGGVGNNTSSGQTGGASSFGSIITAAGGLGGAYGFAGVVGSSGGGIGGSATGGDINATGAVGGGVFGIASSAIVLSGSGASSQYGGGGTSITGYNTGPSGTGYGAGGAGASATPNNGNPAAGGSGSPGIIFIYEYA